MSYNASGHNERVNYFSNPNVNLPETGTATGVAGISNNAAVLTKNRFNISAVGDESGKCDHGYKGKIDGKIITSSKKSFLDFFRVKYNEKGFSHNVFTFLYSVEVWTFH